MILTLTYKLLLALDVWSDWYKIVRKNRQIKHGLETVEAALAYLILTATGVLLGMVHWLDACTHLVLIAPYRWVVHDLLLNLLRGLPLDYLGSEQQSAETDKLLARLAAKGYNQWVVKLGTLVVAILLAIALQIIKVYTL